MSEMQPGLKARIFEIAFVGFEVFLFMNYKILAGGNPNYIFG